MYWNERLSMFEVASRLKVSPHKIQWWMDKHNIKRRSRSEATYCKQNVDGDPFNIKTNLNDKEQFLLGLALGIYWGEGTKLNKTAVRIGNTDPDLINVFISFLDKICRLKKEKIKFGLQIFDDINKEEALNYWEKSLGFSRKHFFPKVIVSPSQGKGTYRNKSRFGVITLCVCNKKLRDWLVEQLNLLSQDSSVGRARHW